MINKEPTKTVPFGTLISRINVPRIVAGLLALAVNVVLLVALMSPSEGASGFTTGPPPSVQVFFTEASPSPTRPHRHRARSERRPIGAAIPHAMLDVPISIGPPTETVAVIGSGSGGDRDAAVIDASDLRDVCQRVYPGEFTSELAKATRLALRVFVMPDGRIGQGIVSVSSGDQNLDWMTLKCLQAYARLEAPDDAESPTGSWQRLVWNWSSP